MSTFKAQYSEEKRKNECAKIRAKYPDRVPIIVEVDNSDMLRAENLPDLDKSRFLVPFDMVFSSFVHTIRKRMKVKESTAIFLMIKDSNGKTIMPLLTDTVGNIYEKNKSDCGFLFLTVLGERVFG
jgi:GABA(A) receptor-associated protein